MARIVELIFVLMLSKKVSSVINNISPIEKKSRESVEFRWTASPSKIIVGVQWGLRDPAGLDTPKPLFISAKYVKVNISFGEDLDKPAASSYKNRVEFFGNLSIGRAWFRINDLNINDTNQYRATIQESGEPLLPFTVSLTVQPATPSPTTTTTSTVTVPTPPAKTYCDGNPCLNGGTCKNITDGYKCTCANGSTGEKCETAKKPCDGSPCLNGGTCKNSANYYECTCASGWTGKDCGKRGEPTCLSSTGAKTGVICAVIIIGLAIIIAVSYLVYKKREPTCVCTGTKVGVICVVIIIGLAIIIGVSVWVHSEKCLSTGAAVGIVFGFVGLAIIIGVAYLVYKKLKEKESKK